MEKHRDEIYTVRTQNRSVHYQTGSGTQETTRQNSDLFIHPAQYAWRCLRIHWRGRRSETPLQLFFCKFVVFVLWVGQLRLRDNVFDEWIHRVTSMSCHIQRSLNFVTPIACMSTDEETFRFWNPSTNWDCLLHCLVIGIWRYTGFKALLRFTTDYTILNETSLKLNTSWRTRIGHECRQCHGGQQVSFTERLNCVLFVFGSISVDAPDVVLHMFLFVLMMIVLRVTVVLCEFSTRNSTLASMCSPAFTHDWRWFRFKFNCIVQQEDFRMMTRDPLTLPRVIQSPIDLHECKRHLVRKVIPRSAGLDSRNYCDFDFVVLCELLNPRPQDLRALRLRQIQLTFLSSKRTTLILLNSRKWKLVRCEWNTAYGNHKRVLMMEFTCSQTTGMFWICENHNARRLVNLSNKILNHKSMSNQISDSSFERLQSSNCWCIHRASYLEGNGKSGLSNARQHSDIIVDRYNVWAVLLSVLLWATPSQDFSCSVETLSDDSLSPSWCMINSACRGSASYSIRPRAASYVGLPHLTVRSTFWLLWQSRVLHMLRSLTMSCLDN